MCRGPPTTSLFPYTTLFRSWVAAMSVAVSAGTSAAKTSRNRSWRMERSSPVLPSGVRSEEHTSELQSREKLVCRLLLEKKKQQRPPLLDGVPVRGQYRKAAS